MKNRIFMLVPQVFRIADRLGIYSDDQTNMIEEYFHTEMKMVADMEGASKDSLEMAAGQIKEESFDAIGRLAGLNLVFHITGKDRLDIDKEGSESALSGITGAAAGAMAGAAIAGSAASAANGDINEETKALLEAYSEITGCGITEEDYNYLLAISKEVYFNDGAYDSFVAVAYSVINRAVRDHKTIAEVVSQDKQYSAFSYSNVGQVANEDVKRAIEDIMAGKVNNPIGQCTNYFGVADNTHNLWVEDIDDRGSIYLVGGNLFYTDDDYGYVHNYDSDPKQYEDGSVIVYDNQNGTGWINGSNTGVIH